MSGIPDTRLANQRISAPSAEHPAEVVARLGAIQAQDYGSAIWAVGLRTAGATLAAVEQAIASRKIVRTWPMRGTLHFVAAADVQWMLELLTPRVVAGAATRRRQLGLDEETCSRGRDICLAALQCHQRLTRQDLLATWSAAGIPMDPQRGYHLIWRLAQEGLVCHGPRSGKDPTFVLLEDWVPRRKKLVRAEALVELARRYFTSHGPATVPDFVWWSGLKVADAKIAINEAELHSEVIGGVTYWSGNSSPANGASGTSAYLLPAFDEHLLGYRDRSAVLDPAHAPKIVPGSNGVFLPTIVLDGRVAGTWKRIVKPSAVIITAVPFLPLSKAARLAVGTAAEAYGRFLESPVELRFS